MPVGPAPMVLCSTVITTYNRLHRVGSAIRSALDTLPFGEVIVVDDASTDGTLTALCNMFSAELSDGRVRIVALPQNLGVTGAKNAGYASAYGNWVIFLDSDDQYLPGSGANIVQELSAAAMRPIVFFRCEDQGGRFIGQQRGNSIELDLRMYLKYVSFGEALTAVNKKVVGETPPYVTELRGYEGIGCCRLIDQYGPALLSEHVARVYFVDHRDRLSTLYGLWQRMPLLAKGHWMMLKEFRSRMPIETSIAYLVKAVSYLVIGHAYRFCEKAL